LIQKEWPIFELSAESIQWAAQSFESPYLRFTPTELPNFQFNGSAQFNQSFASFNGELNPFERSGDIQIEGIFDLLEYLPDPAQSSFPNIEYTAPPFLKAQVCFDPNFTLKAANGVLQAEALSVNGIRFDHIRAHLNYDEQALHVFDTLIQRQQQWLELGFDYDFPSKQYGVSLVGSAVPYEYNAILPNWWSVIFQDFDFSKTTDSLGDFIIYGSTDKPVANLFFGHARARGAAYKGVSIDEGSLFVRGRERYVEVNLIDVANQQGRAKGTIAFSSIDDEIDNFVSIRYDIDGHIGVEHAAAIFGGSVAEILQDLEMPQAPEIDLEGAYFSDSYPELQAHSFFQLSASTPSPFQFKAVRIDSVSFELYGTPERTSLRNLSFEFASGAGTAAIDVLTPNNETANLNLQMQLTNADKDLSADYLPFIENSADSSDSIPAKYDLEVHTMGPSNDPWQHMGQGTLQMRSKRLGAVQLLGPLSSILQNTWFGFTSLVLEDLEAEFKIENELVRFSKIEINGPQTRILANGTLALPDQSLDMDVRANLIANVGEPDSGFRRFSDVLNPFLKPIPNLLSFNLSGTLEDQKWRSAYDPRNFLPIF